MRVYIHALNSCGMRNVRVWAYRDFLLANGHEVVHSPDEADVALVWTCSFRADMRENSLAEIMRIVGETEADVIVGGCMPDMDRELLRRHFKGRIVNWRDDVKKMKEYFGAPNMELSDVPLTLVKEQLYDDERAFREGNPDADVPYVGRYIQLYISEGCDWECAYCSERLTFPPYRSFPEAEIVAACRRERERTGKADVVLLGDSVGDYGRDIGSSLPALVNRLRAAVPGIKIAMQDVNPYHFLKFYDDMVGFMQDRLILHLQVPYQSASDRVLKLMNRPYNRGDIEKVFGTFNRIGFTEIDSHMIAGFPGETEDDFDQSVQFAVEYRPKYMLVNAFMESPGMPAAKLPNKVDQQTKRRRTLDAVARLKAAGILCNCDYGELARERLRRMNKSKQELVCAHNE